MPLEEAQEFQEEQHDELNQEAPEQEEVNESNPEEDKARKGGWTNKDEWSEAGHNPDDWKSAKNFNEFGDLLANHKSMRKDFDDTRSQFDSRLENQRIVLNAQNEQKIADLEAQRATHVENADIDAFNATQKQIDNLATVNEPAPVNNDQSDLNQWNASNAWINDNSPKAAFAKSEFGRLNGSGMSVSQSIEMMEASVKNSFPDVNERRNQAPRGEVPRRSNTAKPKTLSMNDATPEDMKFRHMFNDEKEFLQAIKDTRD